MSHPTRHLRSTWSESAIAAALVFIVLVRLPSLARSLEVAIQPRGLSYTEGINAILATRPDIWFQPVEVAPHFPTIYPLGYHALVNALWQASGLSPFIIMHALGLTSAAVGAGALYRLVEARSDGWHGPAVAAAVYALSPAVTGATVLGRVDHLGVALGLLALLAADRRRLELAIVLTVAAMYVKHSLVVFPIVALVMLYHKGGKWDAATYGYWVTWLGLGILAVMYVQTDGQAWTHLVTYNALHPWRWGVLAGQTTWFAYTHLALVVVLLFALVTGRVRFESGTFAVVAVVLALLTVGKIGSWVGYFLPTIAAAAWVLGEQISLAGVEWRREARLGVAVVIMVQAMLFASWAGSMTPEFDADAQQRALDEVEALGGPILAEDGTLYVEAGVGLIHEPLMMRFIYDDPAYRGGDLTDDIAEQRFRRIVTSVPVEDEGEDRVTRWNDRELEAIGEHYSRVWHVSGYYVYAPRGSSNTG